ncbi:hypothetical protein DFQ29_001798 [Apophysomyces sp. BC1021]|nr:hypothetical protein DFQ29_001798 [Apophysomyces sp. BC1021]
MLHYILCEKYYKMRKRYVYSHSLDHLLRPIMDFFGDIDVHGVVSTDEYYQHPIKSKLDSNILYANGCKVDIGYPYELTVDTTITPIDHFYIV